MNKWYEIIRESPNHTVSYENAANIFNKNITMNTALIFCEYFNMKEIKANFCWFVTRVLCFEDRKNKKGQGSTKTCKENIVLLVT